MYRLHAIGYRTSLIGQSTVTHCPQRPESALPLTDYTVTEIGLWAASRTSAEEERPISERPEEKPPRFTQRGRIGEPTGCYHSLVVASGGMAHTIKRTLSMRPEVDRMLTAHVESTPGASLSSTVNDALVEYLEAAALEAYRQWDAEADAAERAALDALAAHDDQSWAAG